MGSRGNWRCYRACNLSERIASTFSVRLTPYRATVHPRLVHQANGKRPRTRCDRTSYGSRQLFSSRRRKPGRSSDNRGACRTVSSPMPCNKILNSSKAISGFTSDDQRSTHRPSTHCTIPIWQIDALSDVAVSTSTTAKLCPSCTWNVSFCMFFGNPQRVQRIVM